MELQHFVPRLAQVLIGGEAGGNRCGFFSSFFMAAAFAAMKVVLAAFIRKPHHRAASWAKFSRLVGCSYLEITPDNKGLPSAGIHDKALSVNDAEFP